MKRVLLLLPTTTYRTADFLDAVSGLDVEVIVGSERTPALAGLMEGRALRVDFRRPDAAARAIVGYARERPLDAIVPVDDEATLVAATAAAALGLPHNHVEAVAASKDKERTRECLVAAGLRAPRFTTFRADTDPQEAARAIASGSCGVAFPCVVKPVDLSGSRGVIRADDQPSLVSAFSRVAALVTSPDVCPPGDRPQRILVEDFIAGSEVALEGLLRSGTLEVLAIFDKPDPLDGPYFEETIYITPSRLPPDMQDEIAREAQAATRALGLTEGPIHAELRLNDAGAWVLEVAARSIGGLCSRTLRFGAGISLEELIVRHAAGLEIPRLERERRAAGVMMLPIADRGTLREIRGQDDAKRVPGIEGLVITMVPGSELVPLPEGDRYLGFMFARAKTPEDVEHALREAHAKLETVLERAPPRASAEEYDARYERRAAAGEDVHGEATFVMRFSPASVLDAGCGTGRVARELARRGVVVVGVDVDAAMLVTARRKSPDVAWRCADLASVELGRTFDVILLAGNVMIFLAPGSESAVITNLVRHLAPGGLVIAGFQLQPGRLSAERYDKIATAAGLMLSERWSTWDRGTWDPRGDYVLSVHASRA